MGKAHKLTHRFPKDARPIFSICLPIPNKITQSGHTLYD